MAKKSEKAKGDRKIGDIKHRKDKVAITKKQFDLFRHLLCVYNLQRELK